MWNHSPSGNSSRICYRVKCVLYDPTIISLGIYNGAMKTLLKTCSTELSKMWSTHIIIKRHHATQCWVTLAHTPMWKQLFIVITFMIVKDCKQPKFPSNSEEINKRWYSHKMEYYIEIRKNQNFIALKKELLWLC